MKIKSLILFNLFLTALNAHAVNLADCSSLAPMHGHHLNPQVLPNECKSLVDTAAGIFQKLQTTNGEFQVYGYKNKIYVDQFQNGSLLSSSLLAGDQSKLEDVIAIDIDESNRHLFVLSKNGNAASLAHYSLDFIGNVAPLRYFISSELAGAVNLRIDSSAQEVFIVDQASAAIHVHHLYADASFNNSARLRKLSGVQSLLMSPIDVALSQQEMFVLDGDRILVFAKSSSGDVAPVRIISGENTQIATAKSINIDGSEILIRNGNEQTLRFALNGNGNIAPLP
jgi:hypothetical protein